MEPTSQDVASACASVLSEEECRQIAELPLEAALGAAFTLLHEHGVDDPVAFLIERGVLE